MTVSIAHLRKTYGPVIAVRDLSLEVSAGAFFAFLGANGAGKSTTIGCITTTLRPTAGTIRVCGHDTITEAAAVRRSIGAVFQQSLLDPLLSVRENLSVRARLYGMTRRDTVTRIAELTPLVGLDSFLDQRYGRLSGGQKRRADIARAILHRPSVVFLDEPTSGLDPQSRERIWSTIGRLRAEHGTTVFLTTHYMEETERADRVCILARGEIAAEGTPAELRARHSRSILTVRGRDLAGLAQTFEQRGLRTDVTENDVRVHVDSADQARALLDNTAIDDFEFRHGTMDDVFLEVTGGRIA
ncbi:multidrug/hemolysin transport system ATP-binding protein [Microbacterium testaceum]|uniref:ABC transporter ATP-binding protein n=1 Tax=Microbacterium TaxID=33882 RepID=UPI002785B3E0|nr:MULTISPECIES: ABC transporter ATP-binding protein [Microbacterium]MDQ1110998.1 multidrug/hemolysin transport system ATP-binding protein [Microbacterium testaceum]MDR6098462.1 multidrug/hemolysin transport system ATP-binding protein [Microbacterium sp. SORGH_AS_0454]